MAKEEGKGVRVSTSSYSLLKAEHLSSYINSFIQISKHVSNP